MLVKRRFFLPILRVVCGLVSYVARSVLLVGLLLSNSLHASDFEAGLDTTVWHLDPAPLHCRLFQSVPQFGEAGFETLAGESLTFYLESLRPLNRAGQATVKIVAPFWRPGVREQVLGELATATGKRPLLVDQEWANRFLNELRAGFSPAFDMTGWTNQQTLNVAVSAVDFGAAYEGYVNCLAQLYPANYQQLRYTTFHYATNVYGLSAADKARLDLVAGYVKLDPAITKITIHGHTDNQGRRGHNWELSRLRGQTVLDYLKRRGIAEDMLSMNYWGHTRPAVPNTSKANQAKNRRTYIQMNRAEP